MLKKLCKVIVVAGAVLGLTAPAATAADYELNLYGASAQHKFWNAAVPVWMSNVLGCTSVNTDNADAKHGISVGTNCGAPYDPSDTITIRYSSNNSSYGIGTACGIASYSSEDGCPAGQIKMCDVPGSCGSTDRTCQEVHVGASDVELTSFTQTVVKDDTWTYTYDEQCPSSGNQSQEYLDAGCDTILTGSAKSVVVPFGFFANNAITKHRCTEPGPTGSEGEHYAYPHWGWQCDPSKTTVEGHNEDCVGYFKCVDGVCPAGARAGQPCTSGLLKGPLGCPDNLSDTKCEAMPIDNLSRLMVLQIFSAENATWLDRWNQFGPWYPDAGIVRCMRCAGSGTHATFDMQVFRGDATLMGTSLHGRFYHHESSSDLTKCVDENGWNDAAMGGPAEWGDRYAVGYADVDKIINSTSYPNTHIVKYQGVEPARAKIENNEYNFWAAQTLYWNVAEIQTLGLTGLLNSLIASAQDSSFLDTIEPQNMFWTTNGEMACQKVPDERAYPTVVPGSGGGPY